MAYRLGLDIGTNSIGWWALTLDADGNPSGSLATGVRIFSDGRNPKDGTSLAVQRRGPRGMRRRRDRYLLRRNDLMEMLIAFGLMPPDEAERKGLEKLDPYELRANALHGPLTPYELGRAMFHINQRRGFKSNRKTEKQEDNKLTEKIGELKRRILESGAKTLGEYLHKRRLKGKMVRARPEAGFYPDRALYEEEFDEVRKIQAEHHALGPEQWDYLRDRIIFRQRDLRPVDPGWCLLEDGERRAHRALPCAQEFRMVQETNNLRVLVAGERARPLTREERDKVLKGLRTQKEMKLDALWKLLKLPTGTPINLLDDNRKALKGDETAARLKDAFGETWRQFPLPQRTEIVRKLIETEKPEDVERIARTQWGLDAEAAKRLARTPLPEGYARLSEKAIAKLLPRMERQGLGFAEAAAEIPEYGHHSDFRPDAALDRLPYYGAILRRQVVGGDDTKSADDEVAYYGRIANPTVHIGLGQLRRVVNRLIETYGKPQEIVVELARELKMNKEDKDEERRKIRNNEEANTRREQQIKSKGRATSPELLRKLRLWEEQAFGSVNVCPFTGAPISFEMAISDKTEIEHVLPFSKTLDDSMANKVVCLREVNRIKRDRAPAEAFQSNPTAGKYRCNYNEILLRADKLPPNKRWRFHPDAMERFADERGFLDRQLNETKYLSRIARTYLAHLYNEKAEGRLRVRAIPGRLTAMLRGKWGLNALLRGHNRAGDDAGDRPARKNRDDHRHHALDAFVIAMTDQRLLKQISDLNSEDDRKRLIEAVPPPWEGFTPDALRPHLDRIVVSHKPDHATLDNKSKTSGALHNDTAYSPIAPNKGGLQEIRDKAELLAVREKNLRTRLEELWEEAPHKGGKTANFAKRAAKEIKTLQKGEGWTVTSRSALASFLKPEAMDTALPTVRDLALRAALIAAWEEFKRRKPTPSAIPLEETRKKQKNLAGQFADHIASSGVELSGRNVKIRRVRMVEKLSIVQIKDRKTGIPYKAYKPDGNAFADIYRMPDGRWTATVIQRFDANQPNFDPVKFRPHPAAKKIMRLHIDDMVALEDGGFRRILRVVKMSGQTITLASHLEGGALKTRDADKDDIFKYISRAASGLKEVGFRKVGVDEIGRLIDPGPYKG